MIVLLKFGGDFKLFVILVYLWFLLLDCWNKICVWINDELGMFGVFFKDKGSWRVIGFWNLIFLL